MHDVLVVIFVFANKSVATHWPGLLLAADNSVGVSGRNSPRHAPVCRSFQCPHTNKERPQLQSQYGLTGYSIDLTSITKKYLVTNIVRMRKEAYGEK